MIFDYIESRRGHTGEHILGGCCKLCNMKQNVWYFDETSFMTTKKLYNHNYKPYNVTKYAINLCKECFCWRYNEIGDKNCEVCDDVTYKYHPNILDNEFNRIEIPRKFTCSEKAFIKAYLLENRDYDDGDEALKNLDEDNDDCSEEKMEEHVLCLECYAKNEIGDDKDILELTQYYVENVVNDWKTFNDVTMEKVYEYESDYIDGCSFEGAHYARKNFEEMPIDVKLLRAGVTKKEDYVQISAFIHKANVKFI